MKLQTKILSGYIAVLTILVIVVVVLVASLNDVVDKFTFLVEHDQPVLANAAELEKTIVDMETGIRGYMITGNTAFLEPYNAGLIRWDELMAEELELTSGDLEQQAVLRDINQQKKDWVEQIAEPFIALRQQVNESETNRDAIAEIVSSGAGKAIMDEIRGELAAIIAGHGEEGDYTPITLAATLVLQDMIDRETGLRGFLVTGGEEFLEPYDAGSQRFDEHVAALRMMLENDPVEDDVVAIVEGEEAVVETVVDAEGLQHLDKVIELAARWEAEVAKPEIEARRAFSLNEDGLEEIQTEVGAGRGKRFVDAIRADTAAFRAEENRLNANRSAEAQQLARSSITIAVGVGTAGLVIGLAVGLIVSRTTVSNVQDVMETAQAFASGELDQRSDVDSQDEIGQLADSFNQMADQLAEMVENEVTTRQKLQETVSEYMTFVSQVAEGNLTRRLDLSMNGNEETATEDPLVVLGQNLNIMVNSLAEITVQTRSTSTQVSSAAAEILAAATQQLSTIVEQDASISQTSTTVDEVQVTVQQTAQRAETVAKAAQRSVEVGERGLQAIQDSMAGMQMIRDRVEGIAENILALSEKTQQIGEIINTVNEIAAQSNMLALNASVEAARAGEHGKGFAVVAVEVRNLAEQSRQATEQVRAILNEIQQATNSAVMATEEGTKGVDAGQSQVLRAGRVIEELAQVIRDAAQSAVQIATSTQQQTSGMDQLAAAMQAIRQASMQSQASTRQAENSARGLNDMALQMQETMERYQLN